MTADELMTRAASTLEQIAPASTRRRPQSPPWSSNRPQVSAVPALKPRVLATNVTGANVAIDGLDGSNCRAGTCLATDRRADQPGLWPSSTSISPASPRPATSALSAFAQSLGRARGELQQLAQETGAQDNAVEVLAERAAALQNYVGRLTTDVKDQLSVAIGDAEAGADRLIRATGTIRPELDWMREAAIEASDRIRASATSIAEQQDRFSTLLATLDEGVGTAGQRLTTLAESISRRRAKLEAEPRNRPGADRRHGPG